MNILIVDDHPLFLAGLSETLNSIPHLTLTLLTAHDVASALQQLTQTPDIDWVCLDLHMPGGDGFELMNQIRANGFSTPMVILSGNENPVFVERALAAGAVAYISKSAAADELVSAFTALRDRGYYFSPSIRRSLDEYRDGIVSVQGERIKLTRRQRQILNLVAAGHPNREIADTLNLAESTVKAHVSTLFDLLRVDNRAACVRAAILSGIADLDVPDSFS